MQVELLFIEGQRNIVQGIFIKKNNVKTEKDAELIANYVRMSMTEQCKESNFSALDVLSILKEVKSAYLGFFVELVEGKPNPYNKLPMQEPKIFTITLSSKEFQSFKEESNKMNIKLFHEIMNEYQRVASK